MKIKSIRQYKKLTGKKVLLRVGFNVPIEKGKIKDDYKIVASLPTIRFLLRHKCKVIIVTHLGRPMGSKKYNKLRNQYSVKPIATRLSRMLGRKVKFVDDCVGFKVGTEVSKMENGQILMLGNLRFYKGEEANSKKFAKELAGLADIYVNDAFSASHRNHASVSAIKRFLPSYAGILLEHELVNINKVLRPQKPLILVIGGAKIATKIQLIKKLYKKTHRVLIGGALANNFFAAHKLEVGKSLVDKQSIKFAKKFSARGGPAFGWKKTKIILPIDVVVCSRKDGSGKVTVKNVYAVNKNEIILD
ncbi:phosphoglycerate kinase, partial [Candidatus Parcubacteria bacterium]|nr:phosphoglycerate kinase [Candidatus Parcubacteria bacterium]